MCLIEVTEAQDTTAFVSVELVVQDTLVLVDGKPFLPGSPLGSSEAEVGQELAELVIVVFLLTEHPPSFYARANGFATSSGRWGNVIEAHETIALDVVELIVEDAIVFVADGLPAYKGRERTGSICWWW